MTQDTLGNMWFGTFGGSITVYNGITSKYITPNEGLPHHSILELYTAKNGNIWIGTANGLAYYNGIEIINPLPEISYGIRSIVLDDNENVWFAGDSGTYFYDWKNLKKISESSSIKNEIFIDNEGIIYYATKEGFVKNLNNKETLLIDSKIIAVRAIFQDSNDNIWVGTSDGLYKIYSNLVLYFNKNSGLPENSITDITEDNDKNIWISTEESGISIYNGGSFVNISEEQGIGFNYVMSLYTDYHKNVWLGIDGKGTYLFKGFKFKQMEFSSYFENNFIMAVYVENQNKIWLGTDGDGIIIIENGFVKRLTTTNGLVDDHVYFITKDLNENYWFATNEGLSKYDGNKFINFKEDKIGTNDLMTLHVDKQNNLWVGSNGEGIIKMTDKEIFMYGAAQKNFNAYTCWDIFEDTNGDLYFSTENGLYKITGSDTIHYSQEQGLNDLNLGSIGKDTNGIFWIGTDSGISRFDGNNFKNYSKSDGLSSNMSYITCITPNGKLISGNEKGIDIIEYTDSGEITSVKFLGKDDGFLGVECNFNAYDFDTIGNMYIGTMSGLMIYNTNSSNDDEYEAITHITNIKLFYQDCDWTKYTDSISTWNKLPVNLVLRYKNNNLTFEFGGIDFQNPHKVTYKFMLEGFDEEWMPPTTLNYATYSNIPPGEYTFKVIAITKNGIENSVPASFTFKIKPPFWQTQIFNILVFVVIISTIIIIINLRTKKLKNEKIKLEKLVKLRTAEIIQQKEEIQAHRDEIELQKEEIQQQRDLATKQRDALVKQKKDITDSIFYAKRIQTALLPQDSVLKGFFSDYFIIHRPRDIVSGDFYWIKKIENNVIIAVADCTGHGVPGAFMSLLGTAFLNEIVARREITQTAQVLNELRTVIKSSLKQEVFAINAKDGMDMTICCYNTENKQLQYSGAYNSMAMVKKNSEDKFEIVEIEGDKMPIGIHYAEEVSFTNHSFQLNNKERIYLFTDGYYHQIGNVQKRKYSKSAFLKTLLSIQKFGFKEQKDILEQNFDDWKGDFKQIDDILVVGIKF